MSKVYLSHNTKTSIAPTKQIRNVKTTHKTLPLQEVKRINTAQLVSQLSAKEVRSVEAETMKKAETCRSIIYDIREDIQVTAALFDV